jgi:hypothetical protein
MPSLGFTLETNFARQPAPRRRGVGGQIDEVDTLVARKKRRAPVKTYIGLALIAAVVVVTLGYSDTATVLLRQLAGLP